MKSDWHRYNLKRRVAQLPAISEPVFNAKIASLAEEEESPAELKSARKQVTKKDLKRQQKEALQAQRRELLAAREALQEKFGKLNVNGTEQAKESNETSGESGAQTPHTAESQPQSGASDEAAASESEKTIEEKLLAEKLANRVEIPITTCLFCPAKKKQNFATLEENIEHMFKDHGLYIPERKYLVDPEGLIRYLGEKIGLGNMCLCCSYQGKNLEAVREHMASKRHMRIPYETEAEKLEISDFYDFTSSYGDVAKPVAEASADDNEDWEDVSDDGQSDGDGDDDEIIDDDAIPEDPIIDMGTELILPSGAVVGHRSMAKYYKQNFPPERILSEGQGTVIAAETRHFVAPGQRQELAMAKRAWSSQKKREDTNDRRAQKFINNQPHFRDPLLQ
ncbi:hypothetical protein JCM33374_g4398 [Metschnikowia sp. JCM 33374]|nr:hypothetical protein JCM33374_g4398 [Metschnikowia sp. JCM 33374]